MEYDCPCETALQNAKHVKNALLLLFFLLSSSIDASPLICKSNIIKQSTMKELTSEVLLNLALP